MERYFSSIKRKRIFKNRDLPSGFLDAKSIDGTTS